MEEESSSAAAATVWTRWLASVAAEPTTAARRLVPSAVDDIDLAVVSSSPEPEAIRPTSWPTEASKRSASEISASRFSCSLRVLAATCSASSVRAVSAVCRSTSSVSAMRPISSPRSVSSTALSMRAVGDVLHAVLLAVERAEHVAGDQPGQRRHQQHQADADRGELQRQRAHVGVDVVDIEAVADRRVPGRELAREYGLADGLGLAGARDRDRR